MTAEIAIMNRSGIALAADSAVTISFPESLDGRFRGSKIFSTNKLFMLSKYYPVGIMIYGNASIMGVPWELVIKEYRKKELGENRYPYLQDYGASFIRYLNGNKFYFPDKVQDEKVFETFSKELNELGEAVNSGLRDLLSDQKISDEPSFEKARKRLFSERIEERLVQLEALEDINTFKIGEKSFHKKYNSVIDNLFAELVRQSGYSLSPTVRKKLKRIAFLSIVKNTFGDSIESSGVVISGYGEEQIYPSIIAYDIEGVVSAKLKYLTTHKFSIGDGSDTYISPFAQLDMVKTFMDGVSPGYEQIVVAYLRKMFDAYPTAIADKLSGLIKPGQISSLEKQLKDIGKEFFQDFRNQTSNWVRINNSDPILDAVQALPIEELASMAEALVNLTSFKRRVTPVLETVGGPIDVAVITKGDGFVWIQRKHYFEANKNPHFSRNYYIGDTRYEEDKDGKNNQQTRKAGSPS
jgi:hypothetical protein